MDSIHLAPVDACAACLALSLVHDGQIIAAEEVNGARKLLRRLQCNTATPATAADELRIPYVLGLQDQALTISLVEQFKRKRQTNHTIDSGQLSIAGNPG